MNLVEAEELYRIAVSVKEKLEAKGIKSTIIT
jgi:hypothetical protein